MRVIVGILSANHFEARRAAVRATWASAGGFERVFLLGGASSTYVSGDVLHCSVPDDYPSLPQKTRCFCQWALHHYDFDYLFKCDDDTYVHVERLIRWRLRSDYIGHDLGGFASGGAGYYLSRRAAELVANQLTMTEGPEDVLVGEVMASAGVRLEATDRLHPWKNDWPRADNNLITAHYCTPERMAAIHQDLCRAS